MKILLHIPEIHHLVNTAPCYLDAHALESSDDRVYVAGSEESFWLVEANQILCEYVSLRFDLSIAEDITYYDAAIEELKDNLDTIACHIHDALCRLFRTHAIASLDEIQIVSQTGKVMLSVAHPKENLQNGRPYRFQLQRKDC